jgi:hypothetical protein
VDEAKFKPGDRVLVVKHADWKCDLLGTVLGCGRIRRGAHGEYMDYYVQFDEPQRDLTDEMHGHDRTYQGSTVAEKFLRPAAQSYDITEHRP